jgi:NAD(P)-dependent dehydrogenase (short-subunit alcohol dehydrogenase family)
MDLKSKHKLKLKQKSSIPVALVTGGSRGIGLAIVKRFKEEGWQVATCATQAKNLKGSPADFAAVCDVTQVGQVKKFIAQSLKNLKRIDVLINNAGLTANNSMDPKSSDALWHQILDVNLHGTYYFCKYAGHSLPDGSGKILNIASVLARMGVPDAIAYCVAKHGVLGLTRALAQYFAPRRINVNALCPGWVRTDMALSRFADLSLSEENAVKGIPLGRMIEPEEIADFAYQLVTTPGASMLTGQGITLDGGAVAPG